jgi:hypothetical protein
MSRNRSSVAAALLLVATMVLAPATATWSSEGPVTVTEARISVQEGFDRVVFETAGEGEAGWAVSYVDEAISDRSGLSVPVAGAAVLRLSLTGIGPDGDPADAAAFEGDLPGLDDGIILEVVNDGVFEGQHTFFVGLDEQLPFRVLRVDEPKGVVLDVLSDPDADAGAALGGDTDADAGSEVEAGTETDAGTGIDADVPAPEGGVDAGFGGAAVRSPLGAAVGFVGLLLLATGAVLLVGRRSAA